LKDKNIQREEIVVTFSYDSKKDRYAVLSEIYTHVSQRDIGRIKSPLDFERK